MGPHVAKMSESEGSSIRRNTAGNPPSAVMQAALTAAELARTLAEREPKLAQDFRGEALRLAREDE